MPHAEPTLVLPDPDAEPLPEIGPGDELPARYVDLGRIGVGGMGEVRRVRDRELGRTCAYKVIRADQLRRPHAVARFLEEAQVAAQLQHPNIPPVYDAGRLPDGRPWFTMKEVRGRTFTERIQEAHRDGLTAVALRQLVDVFARVAHAVGYAHARGVLHRDLKPDNVMVAAHGETLVLDWGIAKVLGRAEGAEPTDEPEVASSRPEDTRTRVGRVVGTPAYMPPEQARGHVDQLDARADTYALGAMLFEILTGERPFRGFDAMTVLRQVVAGPPALPAAVGGLVLPDELVSLCGACMAQDPHARPPDGTAVAAAARAWLDGAQKRAKALEIVAAADALLEEMERLRQQAATLAAQGRARLADVPPWAPEQAKAGGWRLEDEAERVGRAAALLEFKREALLEGALTHAPGLPEAHTALAALELARHQAAEAARDADRAARAEVRLREHAQSLAPEHPQAARIARYLAGDGTLTLLTDPPGAEVTLARYERRDRRLVEAPVQDLGRTPLIDVPLPRGSYLCVIRHPDRAEVRYPVSVGRGEPWHGVPPGASEPLPLRLPRRGELGPDEVLVPAGWSWSGGDPEALDGLPRRRVWCDAFVIQRFPVTNRAYLAFLDDLVATGREADALRHQPCERVAGGQGAPVYGRDASGRFVLRPDADGHLWDPDWPVVLVDWFDAQAYAAWLAARTGRPWRLPGQLEWEKAARGVDGRLFPWGDVFDASWCCARPSHAGRPLPAVVDSFPVDTSVYGVRGLGGNVQDWTGDVFLPDGPDLAEGVVPEPDAAPSDPSPRIHGGGFWAGPETFTRSATRLRNEPGFRFEGLGLRLAYRPG